jgi:hypothetical protein
MQLQAQVALAATMDARAIGIMGIDAALAAIVVSARFPNLLRIATLAALILSAGLAGRLIFLENDERIGPLVARLLALREFYDDHALEETILKGVAADVKANEHMLARGARRLAFAFVLLVLAAQLILIGSLY